MRILLRYPLLDKIPPQLASVFSTCFATACPNQVSFTSCHASDFGYFGFVFFWELKKTGRSSFQDYLKKNKPSLFSRWWFQICFIFTPIWGRFPI